jgi:hypothetical protein
MSLIKTFFGALWKGPPPTPVHARTNFDLVALHEDVMQVLFEEDFAGFAATNPDEYDQEATFLLGDLRMIHIEGTLDEFDEDVNHMKMVLVDILEVFYGECFLMDNRAHIAKKTQAIAERLVEMMADRDYER